MTATHGWASSNRHGDLPADWSRKIQPRILKRDHHRCQIAGPNCAHTATEVDHIGDATDHRDEMLRAACTTCHKERTQAQAQQARGAGTTRWRKRETHPGLL
jgi:5-methylcytosine-specific restriction protein A